MWLNISTLAVGMLLFGVVVARFGGTGTWTPWHIVGLAIAAPAFALFVLARIQLGRAFSVRAKATSLVTDGIYARIRNPIYLFAVLMVAGLCIFAHRPWWLLIFVIMIPVQLLRVRKEEQVLEARFGDAYREYKRKTWF